MSTVDEWRLLSKDLMNLRVANFLEMMKMDVIQKMSDGESRCGINDDASKFIALSSSEKSGAGIGWFRCICKIDNKFLKILESNGFHLVSYIYDGDYVTDYKKINANETFELNQSGYELSLAW